MSRPTRAVLLGIALFVAPSWAWAQNEGQTDLDKAIEAKVAARSLNELGQVIELCQSALDRGLDKDGVAFAKQLLSSTLVQRATVISEEAIFNATPSDQAGVQRWVQFRQFAVQDLERALRHDPNLFDAHFLLGKLHGQPGGDAKRGLKALDEAVRLAGDDPTNRSKALVARGDLQEDAEKRLADYNEAIKLAPEDDDALRSRGEFHLAAGRAQEALADFDAVLKLKPDDAATHAARGTALALLDKFDDALKSLDKSLELVPRSPFAYIQRARVHAVQENPKEAINDLDKALLIQPDNIQALLLRATMYQQDKKVDKALADVEAVLKQQPGLVAALRIKALLLADANRLDEAIADLEQVRKGDEQDRDAELMVQLAILYGLNKQPQKAIEVYSELIKSDPTVWIAWRGRGDLYLTHGEQAKAKDDFEEALKLQPKDSGILNNLAWLLATSPDEKLRDGKRSIELATVACEVTNYKEAHILSTLAAGYAEAGEWDKAVDWSQKSLDAGEGDIKEQLAKELESYKQKKPWRELLTDGEPATGSSDEKKKSEEPGKG